MSLRSRSGRVFEISVLCVEGSLNFSKLCGCQLLRFIRLKRTLKVSLGKSSTTSIRLRQGYLYIRLTRLTSAGGFQGVLVA